MDLRANTSYIEWLYSSRSWCKHFLQDRNKIFELTASQEESTDLHPPGQEYHHFSEAEFATVRTYRPGYTFRDIAFFDEQDVVTLEHLNLIGTFDSDPEVDDIIAEENFPYFQFALIGKQDEEKADEEKADEANIAGSTFNTSS